MTEESGPGLTLGRVRDAEYCREWYSRRSAAAGGSLGDVKFTPVRQDLLPARWTNPRRVGHLRQYRA